MTHPRGKAGVGQEAAESGFDFPFLRRPTMPALIGQLKNPKLFDTQNLGDPRQILRIR